MDPTNYKLHEAGCWNPETEMLTLTVAGQEYTMTYKDWSSSMVGSGRFAAADTEIKLEVTSKLEESFLSKYYRIPLAATTSSTLLSHQVEYYTDEYNIMYGFGGLRLMRFLYDDYEWAEFVRENGGRPDYE